MEKAFIKPYEQGWASKPAENSWVTPEIMDNYDQAIDKIDNRVIAQSEDLTQIYADGFASKNWLNESDITVGSYNAYNIKNDGIAHVSRTNTPIKLESGKYTINASGVNRVGYVSENTYQSPQTWFTLPYTFDAVNENYKFIFKRDDNVYVKPTNISLNKGTDSTYTPYAKPNTELTQIVDDAIDGGYLPNNLTKDVVLSHTYIHYADGQIKTDASYLGNTIKYPCVPSAEVELKIETTFTNPWICITEFDASGNRISSNGTYTKDLKYNVRSNTSQISFCIYSSNIQPSDIQSVELYVDKTPSNIELKENLTQLVNYSTNEVAIGKWIDGKTIYRRVINVGHVGSNAVVNVATISGISEIVRLYGKAKANDYAQQYPLPFLSLNASFDIVILIQSEYVQIRTGSGFGDTGIDNVVIVAEYTK